MARITMLAFDTAPVIYFIERHPAYLAIMREVFRRVAARQLSGYTSVITLTEVPTIPRRAGDVAVVQTYRELLVHGRDIVLVSIDPATADLAADLRARYRLRTADALQVAAALREGCQALLTNDSALRRVSELSILLVDELTL
ncbi:MAG: type II toxin-antitoxin system VapC family toxin [Chloroflexi bacterium]|nr:type II toxin-antitoxin system VapC family toxin [Chloroflexota bacterium]